MILFFFHESRRTVMRRGAGLMAWCAAGVLGMAILVANEKPPAEYVNAMKNINAANQALRGHVQAKDYDGIAKDAAALKPAFEAGLKYWSDKKVDDATGWAKDAVKASEDLEAAAKEKNDEKIAAAQRTIGGSCRTCHTAHRAQAADGSYEIK
jgi:hypothetical protein